MQTQIIPLIEERSFKYRSVIIACFVLLTIMFCINLGKLRLDTGFNKLLPLHHEYMQTFSNYHTEFGGANRILIALMAKQGDIFNEDYFSALQAMSNDVFFINGVQRGQIRSLYTPNVRFTEVVEDGIVGGNVIPNDFHANAHGFHIVKQNIYKANIIGRLVANDFSGTLISAQLQEVDANTGEKLDYFKVAEQLEKTVRKKYQDLYPQLDIHIIGYAKYVGDIAEGARQMIWFFFITILIISLLVIFYTQHLLLALIPVFCSLCAVIWQLGILPMIGFGIDPMSMLVPFLIFAIGISHGMQMISRIQSAFVNGNTLEQACRSGFRQLFLPGAIALLSDTMGFVTILLIDIDIIREMAITASIGVAIIILTNLIILPLLVSCISLHDQHRQKVVSRMQKLQRLWLLIASVTRIKTAWIVIIAALFTALFSLIQGKRITIGDQHSGASELHQHSQYNIDSALISEKFAIGVDVLNVIVETDQKDACTHYEIMKNIDDFTFTMQQLVAVKDAVSLPLLAKYVNTGWNEGYMKWRELPRNSSALTQSIANVPTASGLLNADCSVMSVMLFTHDHKQATIEELIDEIQRFIAERSIDGVNYRLATGNLGVIAATNDEVKQAQFPILMYVFSVVILLCLLAFGKLSAALMICLPLALVSVMSYALMSLLDIGLKVNTLPVVALGVGIGVDYGIYLYSGLKQQYQHYADVYQAYLQTLTGTGYSILFTGITLSLAVLSWVFSPLKFQMDMGVLLVFMFFVNMLAALLIMPALHAIYAHYRQSLL